MAALRKRQANKSKDVDLESMVQSGASGAYEALQLYRSRAARMKTKGEILDAVKACVQGASVLLANGYENAGFELSSLFIDLLLEDNKQSTDELRTFVFEIDSKFPPQSPHRVEYLKHAIKWSVATGTRELGDHLLHQRLAECLWNNNDKNAAHHFAAGEAPEAYLAALDAKFPSDKKARDEALVIGVVNFLSLENLRDANTLHRAYLKSNESKKIANNGDLLTFTDYLLQTSRRDAAPLFKTLVNSYASQLDFDDAVPTLLMGPVAARLFGIKPKVNPMMSMLQSMMS